MVTVELFNPEIATPESVQKDRRKYLCILTAGAPVSSFGFGIVDETAGNRRVTLDVKDENGNNKKKLKPYYRTIDFAKDRIHFDSETDPQGHPEFGVVHEMTEAEVAEVWKQASRFMVRWVRKDNGNDGEGPGGRYTYGTVIAALDREGGPARGPRLQRGSAKHRNVPFMDYLLIRPVTDRDLANSRNKSVTEGGPKVFEAEMDAFHKRQERIAGGMDPDKADLEDEWARVRRARQNLEDSAKERDAEKEELARQWDEINEQREALAKLKEKAEQEAIEAEEKDAAENPNFDKEQRAQSRAKRSNRSNKGKGK